METKLRNCSMDEPGGVLINTQRYFQLVETALHIVDCSTRCHMVEVSTGKKSANPNVQRQKRYNAVDARNTDCGLSRACESLVKQEMSKIDEPNHQGETALIRAVQLRDAELVRILLGERR